MNDEFPHAGHPSGWYQVAWRGELEHGSVRPLHYFDRDLVLYVDDAGDVHVLDGHCPHMGAHLGHGGRTAGECLVCPFHGWVWGPDGTNRMVPSDGAPTSRRTISTWTTTVANGIVWIWFDASGRGPLWPGPTDLPGVAERERYDVFPECVRAWRGVRMKPQFVAENNVDVDHLHWIHGADGPIDLLDHGPEGPMYRTRNRIVYGYGRASTRLTPDGPIEVDVDAEIWGLGFQYTFFPLPDQAISIQAQTPVDADHCDMFQTVIVRLEPGASPSDAPIGTAAARVREQLVQIERDIPIWENMRYLARPALTRAEAKPVTGLRRWAAQFYPHTSFVDVSAEDPTHEAGATQR